MNRGKGNLGQTLARMTREVSQMVEGYNDEGGSPVHGRFRRGRIGRTSRKDLGEGHQGRTTRWESIHARRKDIGMKKIREPLAMKESSWRTATVGFRS